jgi:hypothetical protein
MPPETFFLPRRMRKNFLVVSDALVHKNVGKVTELGPNFQEGIRIFASLLPNFH